MLSEKEDLTAGFFKSAQKITAVACGVSHITMRRISIEAKNNPPFDILESPAFKSPRKLYKRQKKCTELADVVRRTIHEFYDKSEYPTAHSILLEIKIKC